jgi:hypothetical protein
VTLFGLIGWIGIRWLRPRYPALPEVPVEAPDPGT